MQKHTAMTSHGSKYYEQCKEPLIAKSCKPDSDVTRSPFFATALAHTRPTSQKSLMGTAYPCRKITTLGRTEQRAEDKQKMQQSRVQQENTTPDPRHQEHKQRERERERKLSLLSAKNFLGFKTSVAAVKLWHSFPQATSRSRKLGPHVRISHHGVS